MAQTITVNWWLILLILAALLWAVGKKKGSEIKRTTFNLNYLENSGGGRFEIYELRSDGSQFIVRLGFANRDTLSGDWRCAAGGSWRKIKLVRLSPPSDGPEMQTRQPVLDNLTEPHF
jgi:hypothetical protein